MNTLRGVCLAGPTASGKTAVALDLARHWPVEIISVDSALVYRGMDIGTAKPSAAEQAAVPHHLIDVIEPTEAYSAARFVADATRLSAEIRARGRLPLLVGGTMLYFKALREGLDVLPPADPTVRQDLARRAQQEGSASLHAELARVDPVSAARLAPGDSQRVQRALEVHVLTGRPLSDWQQGPRTPDTRAWPLVALEPQSRDWLHRRIADRFAAMLEAGLVAEVQDLRARGDLHADLPSMRCVGYRQVWQALDRGDRSDLLLQGTAATRQLAKRQLTWLRSTPRHTLPCDADDATIRAREALLALAQQTDPAC
jgi:tRNA dimethylallyltransferase